MGEEQERIPSYVMLDKIDHEIFKAIQNRDVMDCVSDATNNIVALIAEALLSDQAVDELVTLVAQGSRNPIAMMNARAMVKSIIARLLASPTGEEAGE